MTAVKITMTMDGNIDEVVGATREFISACKKRRIKMSSAAIGELGYQPIRSRGDTIAAAVSGRRCDSRTGIIEMIRQISCRLWPIGNKKRPELEGEK